MTDRIDPDYDATDDIALRVATILRHAPMVYNEAPNGVFNKWLLGIVAGLIVVGIPALIAAEIYSSGRLAVLETKVDIILSNWHTVGK